MGMRERLRAKKVGDIMGERWDDLSIAASGIWIRRRGRK